MRDKSYHPATVAAHAAGAIDRASAGAVPGITVATTYLRDNNYALLRSDNSYGRDDNDTVRQLEDTLCHLEGAAQTRAFPSGLAAASALIRQVPRGGRIILQSGIYYGVTALVRGLASRGDFTLDDVDTSDIEALQAACTAPAHLVWIEVPSNPWLKTTDIAAAAQAAHGAGAALVVDATAATPVLMHPLALGADFVMHSATKAINGHSDVMAGVLSTADTAHPFWRGVLIERHDAGAILGPFEAWLCLRGLRTLPLRLERMCRTAQELSERLVAHPAVETVFYPGLPDHTGHDIAKAQMQGGYGSLLSVLINGGHDAAAQVASKLQLVCRATSLGGVESLVEHRHLIEPHSGIPENLLRLSIGIEAIEDLWADLEQALDGVQ